MAANTTDNLLNEDMDIMLSQVAENISFFFIEILMRHTHGTTFSETILDFNKILEKNEQFFILFFKENGKSEAVFQHFWSARRQLFFQRGVTQIWSFFYCKTDNLSCLNKKNCFVNSKVKELFMCFISSAWTNTWGSLCQSFCLIYTQGLVAWTTPLFLHFCLQTYFH